MMLNLFKTDPWNQLLSSQLQTPTRVDSNQMRLEYFKLRHF